MTQIFMSCVRSCLHGSREPQVYSLNNMCKYSRYAGIKNKPNGSCVLYSVTKSVYVDNKNQICRFILCLLSDSVLLYNTLFHLSRLYAQRSIISFQKFVQFHFASICHMSSNAAPCRQYNPSMNRINF